jgi:hypothetical protein
LLSDWVIGVSGDSILALSDWVIRRLGDWAIGGLHVNRLRLKLTPTPGGRGAGQSLNHPMAAEQDNRSIQPVTQCAHPNRQCPNHPITQQSPDLQSSITQ